MDPIIGLSIQCVGIGLVTVLTFFVRGSVTTPSLRYWATAWCCLTTALASLLIGFHVSGNPHIFYSLYFLGEYAFGLMFMAGCRKHARGTQPGPLLFVAILAAGALAAILPLLFADFNDQFMVHAVAMSGLFSASLWALRVGSKKEVTPGVRLMSVALLLLAIDFLHYVPVFGARKGLLGFTVPLGYLQYTSIFDLILEILLGFGTIMVLMEVVRSEVETAHRKLTEAHDTLALLAQMDPLTEALNRHAFHSLLSRNESGKESIASGCVAVIDIDNLKPINDSFGHNVGDKAIRAVARAVRSLIRADDMLFRWGGDEFLVLMLKLDKNEAKRRMESLNNILAANAAQWTAADLQITVSHGVAGFSDLTQLGIAIEQADKAMYQERQRVRAQVAPQTLPEAVEPSLTSVH